jgi:aspartokinase
VTDVDGIYTADPRQAPEAIRLATMGHDELVRLTHAGAEVVHPAAALAAARAVLPLRVLRYSASLRGAEGSVVGCDAGGAS